MNKAVFLDRDGVINIDHGYTYKPSEFEFYPGVFETCRMMQQSGYKLVVVTNQSGIGRGYYSELDFQHLSQWMVQQFAEHDVNISGVYFCPHHPEKAQAQYLRHCDCRKPEPGMLLKAAQELDLDLSASIMIGDKESDVVAGKKAGVKVCVRIADTEVATAADYRVGGLAKLNWSQIC